MTRPRARPTRWARRRSTRGAPRRGAGRAVPDRAASSSAVRTAVATSRGRASGWTSTPPGPTTSDTNPTSVATTGTPLSAASMSDPGMPSVELVETTTSDACSTRRTSGTTPRTWQTPSKRRAASSTSARHGPSPATRRATSESSAAASTARTGRFSRVSAPMSDTTRWSGSTPRAARACSRCASVAGTYRRSVASVGRDRDRGRSDPVQAVDLVRGTGRQRHHVAGAAERGCRSQAAQPPSRPRRRITDAPIDEGCAAAGERDRAGRQRLRAVRDDGVHRLRPVAQRQQRLATERRRAEHLQLERRRCVAR